MYNYKLLRSSRKTLGIEITPDLTVLVRAPKSMPREKIDGTVLKYDDWIRKHIEKQSRRQREFPEPDKAAIPEIKRRAKEYLGQRTEHYSTLMGLRPTGIKITGARKRFGSCSGSNGICFSWRLMQYPEAAIDYVVVHELAHIKQKNHGKAFYELVSSVLPDYKSRRKMLKG
jgi:predicted metal-dependent hydrolase